MFLIFVSSIFAQEISVKTKLQNGDFPLVYKNRTAEIFVSNEDFKVVKIAAGDFASDVERVSNAEPPIKNDASNLAKNLVIIGTSGKNPLIESLIKSQKLDVSAIQNKWESFLIATVKNPFPNVENALVIVGSDRRGTAFGVYEMSQRIGVSPWVWWADVAPEKRESLLISKGKFVSNEPSVKYRGIFLNDEDWGLQPWAARTFEPEVGNIGPKTYAKIFELLLRLKANTCWSAMHEVTKPFNEINGNAQTADDYAIVMGSSHAEPMLRNNVGEWKDAKEKYNFVSNETGVTNYWEDRIKTNGKFENIYTLGMRGIHDSPIQGTRSQAERIPVLEKIIATQRSLLAKYVDERVENVPQIFCPYKEVLADYRAGLKVPDDVTIVFPDDNFGYIRAFPSAEEQKRRGGFGVYYHISYLGRPLSYLWLNSTPPSLIFEEMSKAYENGMRQFWMLNVGDIKPAEIGIEFFMQMAYDAKKWNVSNQNQFLKTWANREFGAGNSAEIAAVMDKYYRLGFQRKPEHLQWFIPKETPRKSDLTETETLERLRDYAELRKRAEAVFVKISRAKKDAFYELVLYPVRSAMLANERFFAAELAETYKRQNRSDALIWARRSIAANAEIERETVYFNEKLANGKWRFSMSPEMKPGEWSSMRSTPPVLNENDFSNLSVQGRLEDKSLPFVKTPKQIKGFSELNGVISMEAENFTRKNEQNGFAWQTIEGLGKTGDSVSVFPQKAQTFADFSKNSPGLEYQFYVSNAGEFEANFFLIPTQPLVPGNGLRLAVSIDDETPQIIAVDKDTEVSSPKWANNILNQTTIGKSKFSLTKGTHVLKIFAVETGIVLDKIVLSSGALKTSYFAPPETRVR
ncbi:MAG TPA: glycosyl hydrolase 115 family protein [Pyrinomonadaceae bacterium]|nr:glycosyl hydrolase 115 family protein [Pyrinomonadaceae bacterium]